MKKVLLVTTILAALAVGWFLARTTSHAGHDHAGDSGGAAAATVYQCPMHPWIKSDRPDAKCTICGMALVAANGGASKDQEVDPNLVTLTPAQAAVVGVQTSPVRRGPLVRTLRVNGVIDDDDSTHRIVAAYVPGRIEKLHVNFVGAEVQAGQPLAEIYSPELLVARQEYHALVRAQRATASDGLIEAARERLLQLGLTEERVDALAEAESVPRNTAMVAPLSGTVITRNPDAAYEGAYVETGTRLFELGDFSRMWFWFDAYEPDLTWLRPGQTVEVSVPSLPGRTLSAPIDFIDPNLNPATRTARVRVVLENPERQMLHRQTASATVKLDAPETLLVPRSAVLQHAGKAVVYVDQGDHAYVARDIELGRRGDADFEVVSGLKEGDRVVTEGALILDGQAQLAHAAVGATAGHDHGTASSSPAAAPVAAHDEAAYALLRMLAFAAADAAEALASDDLDGYRKSLPALRRALDAYVAGHSPQDGNPLATFRGKLAEGPDLDAARRAFEPFSTAVADIARAQHLHHREDLWVYQCPMTPVLGTGRWLSRKHQLRNPFFGSEMLECGEELD